MDQIASSLPNSSSRFGYTPQELLQTERWTKSFIEKYFIAKKDWEVANSNGGCCHNQNCKVYQKFM